MSQQSDIYVDNRILSQKSDFAPIIGFLRQSSDFYQSLRKISYYPISGQNVRVLIRNLISMAIIRFSSQKYVIDQKLDSYDKIRFLSQIIRHWPKIWFLLQWYNFRAKNPSMSKKYQALRIYRKYEFTMVSRDSCFFLQKKHISVSVNFFDHIKISSMKSFIWWKYSLDLWRSDDGRSMLQRRAKRQM